MDILLRLRHRAVEFTSSAGHLLLLVIAFESGDPEIVVACLAAIAGISFFGWMLNFKRGRLIADLPTSRIASAAQGYVELFGKASTSADNLLRSPLSGLPCIWYRYWVYVKENEKEWREVSHGVSDTTFEISDGTGICYVDPDHAEVINPERRERINLEHKHVEELLFAGPIYVLGDFSTVGGAGSALSLKEDVSALLAEWKRNPAKLKAKFDLDGNGDLDLQEWELARRAAVREVEKQHREIRTQLGTHVMRAPKSDRPYLISSQSPHKLRQQYRFWSYVHILILVLATSSAIWLW